MAIATREEALKVLADILDLPNRAEQLIQITVAVSQCTTEQARGVLTRAGEGFIDGHLSTKRRKRREVLGESMTPERRESDRAPAEPKPVRESATELRRLTEEKRRAMAEADMLDQIGTGLDALKLCAVIFDVFEELLEFFDPWELARLAIKKEDLVRDFALRGIRLDDLDALKADIVRHVMEVRPWWKSEVEGIRASCAKIAQEPQPYPVLGPPRCTPQILLDVIAATDLKSVFAIQGNMAKQENLEAGIREVRKALEKILAVMYPQGMPKSIIPYR